MHIMKTLILTITSVFVLQLQVIRAASPEEEARFVAAAKQAFAKHDANALAALTCWDRVPVKRMTDGIKQYTEEVAQTATDITLTNPDPEYPDLVWKDTDGVSYRSNLPVVKQLKITLAPGGKLPNEVTVRYFVGEKEGKLCLLEPAPVPGLAHTLPVEGAQTASGKWFHLSAGDTYVADFTLKPNESRLFDVVTIKPITVDFQTDMSFEKAKQYNSSIPVRTPVRLSMQHGTQFVASASGAGTQFNTDNGKIALKIENGADIPLRVVISTRE